MRRRTSQIVLLILVVGIGGCSSAEAVPEGTGASEAVRGYCDALAQQDWNRAYGTLHPDCKSVLTAEDFARLAGQYRRNLGFAPEEAHLRSCQEHADEAIAHIVWNGHSGNQRRSYKDGLVLRRTIEGWKIVLPRSFGQPPLDPAPPKKS
jgi:hypothetical protein